MQFLRKYKNKYNGCCKTLQKVICCICNINEINCNKMIRNNQVFQLYPENEMKANETKQRLIWRLGRLVKTDESK